MKSSSGQYYLGLDHVRALAAFMVFSWHFIDIHQGQNAPPPIFPLTFLTEGHTGVALFMTLSGYLFAKLLDGKDINYFSFIWNRTLRLLPLLSSPSFPAFLFKSIQVLIYFVSRGCYRRTLFFVCVFGTTGRVYFLVLRHDSWPCRPIYSRDSRVSA